MLIKWTPEMSVGSSIIDAQHKVLLNQIRSLYNALLDNKTESIVKSSLSFLDTYIKSHLNYEEKYMEEHGYPGLEEHKKIHEEFKKAFFSFSEKLKEGGDSKKLATEVQNFLAKWWIDHILREDHKYYEYIKNHPDSEKMMKEAEGEK
jgi:hemerythrin